MARTAGSAAPGIDDLAKDEDHPRVEVQSRAQLRHWLTENHEAAGTIWLVTYKKVQADKHVPYDDIVEEALCFGWGG